MAGEGKVGDIVRTSAIVWWDGIPLNSVTTWSEVCPWHCPVHCVIKTNWGKQRHSRGAAGNLCMLQIVSQWRRDLSELRRQEAALVPTRRVLHCIESYTSSKGDGPLVQLDPRNVSFIVNHSIITSQWASSYNLPGVEIRDIRHMPSLLT